MHKQLGQVRDYLKKNKIPSKTKPGFPSFAVLTHLSNLRLENALYLQKVSMMKSKTMINDAVVKSLYSLFSTIAQFGLGDRLEESFDIYHRQLMAEKQSETIRPAGGGGVGSGKKIRKGIDKDPLSGEVIKAIHPDRQADVKHESEDLSSVETNKE